MQIADAAAHRLAGPARLLRLSREHCGIENKLHYVPDVACREDRAGRAPATGRRFSPRCATPP